VYDPSGGATGTSAVWTIGTNVAARGGAGGVGGAGTTPGVFYGGGGGAGAGTLGVPSNFVTSAGWLEAAENGIGGVGYFGGGSGGFGASATWYVTSHPGFKGSAPGGGGGGGGGGDAVNVAAEGGKGADGLVMIKWWT